MSVNQRQQQCPERTGDAFRARPLAGVEYEPVALSKMLRISKGDERVVKREGEKICDVQCQEANRGDEQHRHHDPGSTQSSDQVSDSTIRT